MMILLDTNVLLRAVEPTSPGYQFARSSVAALHARGDMLTLVPQVFYEYRVVSTRPIANNGRGRSPAEVASEFSQIKNRFILLDDSSGILAEWERVVISNGVVGKTAHDARLVAAMRTHGVSHLLTYNTQDFLRYSGIVTVDPRAVVGDCSNH